MTSKSKKLCTVCKSPISYERHDPSDTCSKKCQVEIEGYSKYYDLKLKLEGTTAWRPHPLEPTMNIITDHPVLVVGDLHCPIHSKEWLERAIMAAKKFDCKKVVLNGDLIDANTISRHLGGEWRRKSELNDDIESAAKVVEIFCNEFDQVFYTMGNHSQRLMQKFLGEVSWQNLLKMIYQSDKFKGTERHFCDINSSVRCLHPRSYSRTRGKLTADLAQRYQMHLITSHHHHSAATISADGKWQAVEIGTLADISMFGYAQYAMHGMPEMLEGFAIVLPPSEDNLILNFNRFTPWKRFGL